MDSKEEQQRSLKTENPSLPAINLAAPSLRQELTAPSTFHVKPVPKIVPFLHLVPPLATPRVSSQELMPPEPVVNPVAPLGDFSSVTNEDFITAAFHQLPIGSFVAVCSKMGDPTEGGWLATRADSTTLPDSNNNYVSCSSYSLCNDGTFKARKDQGAAYHCILFDDLGTKIPMERLGDFEPSWVIETSRGNYQAGIIFAEPITDSKLGERLLKGIMAKGLSDGGASGLTRWARLPKAINGKAKYRDAEGNPFRCRLVQWRPERRYTPQEIIDGLKLELESEQKKVEVLPPKAAENPVINALKDRCLYKKTLGSGKRDITCPWVTDATSLQRLDALVNSIDPDCGYDEWLRVAMSVFHESKGSDDGMVIFDRWSSKGTKYKGVREIKTKWRSFRLDVPNPVTIRTLIMMARDAGADIPAIMSDFTICEFEVVTA